MALVLGAAGAAAPVALAQAGAARLEPAVLASVAVAALTTLLWLRELAAARRLANATPSPPRAPPDPPPFAAMLERLADPILLVAGGDRDDRGSRRFTFANTAARDLLRLQRGHGPLTTAVRAPEILTAIEGALFAATAGEALYDSGGAQGRVWRASVVPLAGLAPMALVSFRDETQFRRGERTRTDFLANASHELRTPLASLAGFIETLRGHARDDAAAREKFLAIMHVQAQRMRRLIDDLMSLSRIELDEHIPPSGEVDLAVAVIDVLDALAPMAADREVEFRSALPAVGESMIVGDRDQLMQVIQNLAENALKYTPRAQSVAVEVVCDVEAAAAAAPISALAAHRNLLAPDRPRSDRYVLLRVRDAGPGIARRYLPRLTERFYRVEGQKSGAHAGTGLGLAIVKHIINRHRGGLTVESTEGQGATFTVYLPMVASTVGGVLDGSKSPEPVR